MAGTWAFCSPSPLPPFSLALLSLLLVLLLPCPVPGQYSNTGEVSNTLDRNPPAVSNSYTPTQTLDMESVRVCSNTGSYSVSNTDIVEVFARPPQIAHSTRDKCLVELRAPEGRRLKVYIMDIVIFDHGTTIQFFDNRGSMIVPNFKLTSSSAPEQTWTSQYNRLVIALLKLSTAANTYRYRFLITTDDGPPLEFGRNDGSYYQQPQVLTTEAIVGIAVAGAIVFFGLLGLGIYCCVHLSREKMDEKAESAPESTAVYSSGTSQVYLPTHMERYQKHKGGGTNSDASKENGVHYNIFRSTPEASRAASSKAGSLRKSKQDFDNKAFEGREAEERRTVRAQEAGRTGRPKEGAAPDSGRGDTLGKGSSRGTQPPRGGDAVDRGPRKPRDLEERSTGSRGRQEPFVRDSATRASTKGRSRSERLVSEGGAYEPVEYGRRETEADARRRSTRDRNRNREGHSGSTRAPSNRDYASRDNSRDYSTRDYSFSRDRPSRDRSSRSQSANGRRDSARRHHGSSRSRSAGRETSRRQSRGERRRNRDGYQSEDVYDDYYDDYRPTRRSSRSRSRHTYDDYENYDVYEDNRRRSRRRGDRSPSIERRGRQYSYA